MATAVDMLECHIWSRTVSFSRCMKNAAAICVADGGLIETSPQHLHMYKHFLYPLHFHPLFCLTPFPPPFP